MAAAEGSGRLIVLDTSGLLALADRRDPQHQQVIDAFDADGGPHVVPAAVLGEIGYMIERDLGASAASAFMFDLAEGVLELDCGEDDLLRAAQLALRYEDLPLGLVDALVIACAERRGGRVLTLDRRDFEIVRREVQLEVLP
jgi:uncharacterized protein